MKVLGIVSGTSIVGVDYALGDVTRRSVQLFGHGWREIPELLRARLQAAARVRGDENWFEFAFSRKLERAAFKPAPGSAEIPLVTDSENREFARASLG